MKRFHEWVNESHDYSKEYEELPLWIEYLEPIEMGYLLSFLGEQGLKWINIDSEIGDDDFTLMITIKVPQTVGDTLDISLDATGTYSMNREESSFSGDYYQPADPDSYILEDVDIDEMTLFLDGSDVEMKENSCIDFNTLKRILQRVIMDRIEFDEENVTLYKKTNPASEEIPPCIKSRIQEVIEQNKKGIVSKKMKTRFNL